MILVRKTKSKTKSKRRIEASAEAAKEENSMGGKAASEKADIQSRKTKRAPLQNCGKASTENGKKAKAAKKSAKRRQMPKTGIKRSEYKGAKSDTDRKKRS